MNTLLDALGGALGDAQQLDAIPEFVGGGEVGKGDRLDALDRNGRGVDLGAEGERSENGDLVGGVEAADVESRVGLGVAELLRFGEASLERQTLRLHPRQDVVAGAVKYARHAAHGIASHAFAQGLDDRNAASDRRLESERRAARFAERSQFEAVGGDHRLVGGHHRQAARQRGARRRIGRPVRAADRFDEHIDLAGGGERRRIVEEGGLLQAGAAFAPAERADRDDGDVAPRARRQVVSPPLHKARQSPADGAYAREADP